jgi:hypothetical protein
MQEICTSGSEGGGTETNRSSLPLSFGGRSATRPTELLKRSPRVSVYCSFLTECTRLRFELAFSTPP